MQPQHEWMCHKRASKLTFKSSGRPSPRITSLPYMDGGARQDVPLPDPPSQTCKIAPPFPGGCTNLAIHLSRTYPSDSIGILVAGNSGRPGGACGNIKIDYKEKKYRPIVSNLHHKHKTQEEDILSNWLTTVGDANRVYESTIGGINRWGMYWPDWTAIPGAERLLRDQNPHLPIPNTASIWSDPLIVDKIYRTRQGVDYREAQPIAYRDAWHVKNCAVSEKCTNGFNALNSVACSLIFVAGPLANPEQSLYMPREQTNYTSTQFRTVNQLAVDDYQFFRSCVKETFRAALTSMALNGDTIAVLCHVSGGIYAGNHSQKYGSKNMDNFKELKDIVNEVLQSYTTPGIRLGSFFEKVVFSPYAPPERSVQEAHSV